MAQLYRGISGSQYVYWDNVTTFMPPGTSNTLGLGDSDDDHDGIPGSGTGGSQLTLYQRVSSSFTYSHPGKTPFAYYLFNSSSRSGVDRMGTGKNFVAGGLVSSSNPLPAYTDILYKNNVSASDALTALNCNGTSNVWNSNGVALAETIFNSTLSYCIELTFKAVGTPGGSWYSFFGNYNGADNDLNNMWWRATDKKLQLSTTYWNAARNASTTIDLASTTVLIQDRWYHCIIQSEWSPFDGSNGRVTASMYLNGLLDNASTTSVPLTQRLSCSRAYNIGYNGTAGDVFNGMMSYFKVYSTNLTATDALAIYSSSFVGIINNGL